MKRHNKLRKGFTLVELVVVIAVIAILGAVSVGAYFGITKSANDSKLMTEAKTTLDGIKMISLTNKSKNQVLDIDGLKVSKDDINFDIFESDLSNAIGLDYEVYNNRPNVIEGKSVVLQEENLILSLNNDDNYFCFKAFNYYTNEVGGYYANVNILTGEISILADTYTEDPLPEPEEIVFKGIVARGSYKHWYFEGETIDLNGLKFYEKYSDGSISNEQIPNSKLNYNKSPLTAGVHDIEISYIKDGITASYTITITVNKILIEDIEIVGTLSKTNYIDGQNIDLTGLSFNAIYNNGTKIENITVEYNSKLTKGQTSIDVTYEGITKTITGLTVEAVKPISLVYSGELTKKSYFEGENISLDGLSFKVINNDNSSIDVENVENIKSNALIADQTEVELTYSISGENLTTTLTGISVLEIKPADLIVSDLPTDLYEGVSLESIKSSLSFQVRYNNSDTYNDVDSSLINAIYKGENQESKGTKTIIFTYIDSITSKSISIEKTITFVDIVPISLVPSSTTLINDQYEGAELDTTGIQFTVTYNNGTSEIVEVQKPTLVLNQTEATVTYKTASYTFKNINVKEAGYYRVDDFNDLKVGDKIIIVSEEYKRSVSYSRWDAEYYHKNNTVTIKFENGIVKSTEDVLVFTLEQGNIEGSFALKCDKGYLTKGLDKDSYDFYTYFTDEITDLGSWKFGYETEGYFVDSHLIYVTIPGDSNIYRFCLHYGSGSDTYFDTSTGPEYDTFCYKLNGVLSSN